MNRMDPSSFLSPISPPPNIINVLHRRTTPQYKFIIIHQVQRKPIEHAKETYFTRPMLLSLSKSSETNASPLIEQK